ncbi:MAG TPA: hypothetical protein VFE52_04160 [Devosia sp.]|jgi:hypothetical protein|nr:hypothetical protein [Devosia sp.]
MRLYATDQVSISSVQADTLKPGQSFEVSDDLGKELLKKLPHAVSETAPKAKAEAAPPKKAEAAAPANKAEAAAPLNKAEPKHQNKSK